MATSRWKPQQIKFTPQSVHPDGDSDAVVPPPELASRQRATPRRIWDARDQLSAAAEALRDAGMLDLVLETGGSLARWFKHGIPDGAVNRQVDRAMEAVEQGWQIAADPEAAMPELLLLREASLALEDSAVFGQLQKRLTEARRVAIRTGFRPKGLPGPREVHIIPHDRDSIILVLRFIAAMMASPGAAAIAAEAQEPAAASDGALKRRRRRRPARPETTQVL